MADVRNYYVMCDDNCKFEGMTKEQTLTAIEQAVSTGTIKDIDTGFITKIVEQNARAPLRFWVGTQAQYNALTDKSDDTLYITDDTDAVATLADAVEKIINGEIETTCAQIANEAVVASMLKLKNGTKDMTTVFPNFAAYFDYRYNDDTELSPIPRGTNNVYWFYHLGKVIPVGSYPSYELETKVRQADGGALRVIQTMLELGEDGYYRAARYTYDIKNETYGGGWELVNQEEEIAVEYMAICGGE